MVPGATGAQKDCGSGELEWLAFSDVVRINRYFGWYTNGGRIDLGREELEKDVDEVHRLLKKPIIIAEFGADTVSGMHPDPPEMFTEEYQVEFLRAYLDVADARDFIIGMHVWNFADFKTGQAVRRVGGMNLKGVFTRDQRPKMAATYLRERWGGRSDEQTPDTLGRLPLINRCGLYDPLEPTRRPVPNPRVTVQFDQIRDWRGIARLHSAQPKPRLREISPSVSQ